jgi:16S rRNA (guanine527-N7)-methyltransferase
VRPGGRLVLYAGEEEGLAERVSAAAEQVAGRLAEVISVPGSERRLLVVVDKTGATPARFPRRPGAAKKRPLA